MIFGWFDARAARSFGSELALAFMALVPADAKMTDRKFEAKARSALTQLGRRVADFTREHRLNGYQKARLGNAFKWALKDAGYDAAYIDKLTDWLILQLQ
ncbi:conserved hypothetical protein [Rubrivivax sp. A210]|uniref:hypothetical protein n=1 Tax=Rubrivivax sp. A210 TaxID=2772301 RepID=UPI001917AC31|nr:hypothetical protein [Rubrivivax sp. A210]CAD5373157.1 conserved hypothetical protein [Rubrivivax sp. A210]